MANNKRKTMHRTKEKLISFNTHFIDVKLSDEGLIFFFALFFLYANKRRHPWLNVTASTSAKNQKHRERSDGFFHHRCSISRVGFHHIFFYVYNIYVAFVFVTTNNNKKKPTNATNHTTTNISSKTR